MWSGDWKEILGQWRVGVQSGGGEWGCRVGVESGGAECSGASVTSHAAVIKYPAGSNFGVQSLLFSFCLFLAYSLRDYSSLWQGRHKSRSVRQLSHRACSQDTEGCFLLCVESWTPALRIMSPTCRVGLPP